MKGIFYSAIAILFITPLLLFVFSSINYNQANSEVYTTKIAGDKLASFSKSVENDLPRAMDIIAKRAMADSMVYIEMTGMPLEDVEINMTNLIVNGTTSGVPSYSDFTLSNWTQNLREKGQQFGFETSVNTAGVDIYHKDSYNVTIEIRIGVNVSFPGKDMQLYRIYVSKTNVPIKGFTDPLYMLNTNGIIKRSVRPPPFSVSGAAAFDTFTEGAYYANSLEGPSFLDRMEGRVSPSGKYNATQEAVGLESVVFVQDLEGLGMEVKDYQSDIDYLYFDTTTHAGSAVDGSAYSWLMIDGPHKAWYNLT